MLKTVARFAFFENQDTINRSPAGFVDCKLCFKSCQDETFERLTKDRTVTLLLVIYLWSALDLYFGELCIQYGSALFLCICQNTRFLKENFYKDLFAFYMSFYKPAILTHYSVNHHYKCCIAKLLSILCCLLCENPSPQITFEQLRNYDTIIHHKRVVSSHHPQQYHSCPSLCFLVLQHFGVSPFLLALQMT